MTRKDVAVILVDSPRQNTKEITAMEMRFERLGLPDLVFNGTLLVDHSNKEPGLLRWSEYRVWKTDTGRWVTELLNVSTVPGEKSFQKLTVCNTALEVAEAFFRTVNGRRFIPQAGLEALEMAIENDSDLDTEERV